MLSFGIDHKEIFLVDSWSSTGEVSPKRKQNFKRVIEGLEQISTDISPYRVVSPLSEEVGSCDIILSFFVKGSTNGFAVFKVNFTKQNAVLVNWLVL